jgi:hypothetical protein
VIPLIARSDGTDRDDEPENVLPALHDHFVDQVLRRARQDDACETVDRHDRQPDREPFPCGPDDVRGVASIVRIGGRLGLLGASGTRRL